LFTINLPKQVPVLLERAGNGVASLAFNSR
jgi:hypothetical protein